MIAQIPAAGQRLQLVGEGVDPRLIQGPDLKQLRLLVKQNKTAAYKLSVLRFPQEQRIELFRLAQAVKPRLGSTQEEGASSGFLLVEQGTAAGIGALLPGTILIVPDIRIDAAAYFFAGCSQALEGDHQRRSGIRKCALDHLIGVVQILHLLQDQKDSAKEISQGIALLFQGAQAQEEGPDPGGFSRSGSGWNDLDAGDGSGEDLLRAAPPITHIKVGLQLLQLFHNEVGHPVDLIAGKGEEVCSSFWANWMQVLKAIWSGGGGNPLFGRVPG